MHLKIFMNLNTASLLQQLSADVECCRNQPIESYLQTQASKSIWAAPKTIDSLLGGWLIALKEHVFVLRGIRLSHPHIAYCTTYFKNVNRTGRSQEKKNYCMYLCVRICAATRVFVHFCIWQCKQHHRLLSIPSFSAQLQGKLLKVCFILWINYSLLELC